jgi:hypothetical protein
VHQLYTISEQELMLEFTATISVHQSAQKASDKSNDILGQLYSLKCEALPPSNAKSRGKNLVDGCCRVMPPPLSGHFIEIQIQKSSFPVRQKEI